MKPSVILMIGFFLFLGSCNKNQYEDKFLTYYGIIVHKTMVEVIVDRDGLIIKVVYDTNQMKKFWNTFVEKGDNLLHFIGRENNCVNEILADARTEREKMRIWLNETFGDLGMLKRDNRPKRQAALLAGVGVASLVALGFEEWQINKLNGKITEIQNHIKHNDENIHILGQAVKFNSKKLDAVVHNELEIGDSLNKLAAHLNESIQLNNDNVQNVACVQLKMVYLNTNRIVKEAFHEVNDILNFKLDRNLLDFSVRKEICAEIKKSQI